jgi:predicted acetyltransferase
MEQVTNIKRPRIRRSNEQILHLLEEFKKSGLSVKQFCMTHNLSKGTFHKWQSKNKNNFNRQKRNTGFAEVHVLRSVGPVQTALFAEVNGIKLYQPVAAAYLKELV